MGDLVTFKYYYLALVIMAVSINTTKVQSKSDVIVNASQSGAYGLATAQNTVATAINQAKA